MKKHITEEELMLIGEENLAKIFNAEKVVICDTGIQINGNYFCFEYFFLRYFDIGYMFLLLDKYWIVDEIYVSRREDNQWNVSFNLDVFSDDYLFDVTKLQLIDALLEALLYVLDDNK